MGRLCLLAIVIGWTTPADAFFCFNFGANSGGGKRLYPYRNIAYPPPAMLYPVANHPQAPSSSVDDLPPIKAKRPQPELIQGYRFRPLDKGESDSIPSLPTTDSRH